MTTQQSPGIIIDDQNLKVSKSTRVKFTELIQNAEAKINSFRIYVPGGGCNGMAYGMAFADSNDPCDSILDGKEGFRTVIDPLALTYIQGAEIDYSEDGANASFVFNSAFKVVGESGARGGCGGAGF